MDFKTIKTGESSVHCRQKPFKTLRYFQAILKAKEIIVKEVQAGYRDRKLG